MPPSYYHPIQKLCSIGNGKYANILLVAVGPYILSLDLKVGDVLSQWPVHPPQSDQAQAFEVPGCGELSERYVKDGPKSKRRKVTPSRENDEVQQAKDPRDSSTSPEFVSERFNERSRGPKEVSRSTLPNVSHIICTVDGYHVLAVTAEDKCIRVFKLELSGHLKLLSERHFSQISTASSCAYSCVDVCQKDFVL
jgi:tRNA (guanine-N(7)-)-methyltransferase subunit TRM82